MWCYWEQLVEYMRIWGTHTHTLRASSLGTFLATPKPKRKNHQQVKGHNKRVNGPLNTDSQKFKRTPSLDSWPPRFQKQSQRTGQRTYPDPSILCWFFHKTCCSRFFENFQKSRNWMGGCNLITPETRTAQHWFSSWVLLCTQNLWFSWSS